MLMSMLKSPEQNQHTHPRHKGTARSQSIPAGDTQLHRFYIQEAATRYYYQSRKG